MLTPLNVTELSEQLINKTGYEAYTLIAKEFIILPVVIFLLISFILMLIITGLRKDNKPFNDNWWLISFLPYCITAIIIGGYYIFSFFFSWLRLNFS